MATLTGQRIKDSYKDLLQVSNSNSGIDSTLRAVSDGEATSSLLQLSTVAVNISSAGALQYAGVAITSTAAELNILDGATVTVAELNVLDGYTGSVTELNYLDTLHATGVTATEFDYLDGVTSNIQTQLDATLDTAGALIDLSSTTINVDLTEAGEAAIANGDYILFLDGGATGTHAKEAIADVATLFAGAGMTATSSVINVIAGTGIDVAADAISVDVSDFMSNGSNNRILTATGTDAFRGEGNLTFDGSTLAVTGAITGSSTLNVTGVTTLQNHLELGDSDKIKLGASADLEIYHDGTNSVINNTQTGALQIYNNVDDGMIELLTDNGSGGTQVFLRADGANNMVRMPVDGVKFTLGDASDLQLYHDGSNNYLRNNTTDQDFSILVNDGGSTITALQIDASDNAKVIIPNDSQYLTIGAGQDLRFQHNGTNSFIENYTGALFMDNTVSDQDIFIRVNDGGVTTTAIRIDASDNSRVKLANDNQKLSIGASNDIEIFHDGTDSTILNQTGDLIIKNNADDAGIRLQCDDGSGGTTNYITLDGEYTSINLSQNTTLSATKKLYFDGGGDTYIYEQAADTLDFVVGGQQMLTMVEGGTDYVRVGDNILLGAGNSLDMNLKHDGTNSFISNGNGALYIDALAQDEDFFIRVNDGGSTITAMSIDSSSVGKVRLPNDLQELTFGVGGDGVLYSYQDDFWIQNVTQDQDIKFRVNDGGTHTDALFIQGSTTNVGIGTTSPSLKLDVAGDIGLKNNATYLYSKDASGTSTRMFGINGSNNTYIGPIDNYAGGSILYGANANVVDHIFYTGGAERMRIKTSTGNVGIGTGSPSEKLEVSGNIKTTAHLVLPYGEINDAGTDMNIVSTNALTLGTESGTALTFANASLRGVFADDVSIPVAKKLYFGGGDHTYIGEDADDRLRFFVGGAEFMRFTETTTNELSLYENVALAATKKLFLDGGGHSYIVESAADVVDLYAGAELMMRWDETNNAVSILRDADTATFNIGVGSDLELYVESGGADTAIIRSRTGDFKIMAQAADADMRFFCDDGSGGDDEYLRLDGGATSLDMFVDTRLAATKKLYLDGGANTYITETSADLVDLYVGGQNALRVLESSNVSYAYVPDNMYLGAGTGIDFTIRHDASHTYLANSTGNTYIRNQDGGYIYLQDVSGNSLITVDVGAKVVINDSSRDIDFIVEGDTDTHLLFCDGGANTVNIGANSSRATIAGYTPKFNIEGAGAAGYVQIVDTENGQFHGGSLVLHKHKSGGIANNTELGSIWFGGTDSANAVFSDGALIRAMATGDDNADGDNVAASLLFFTNGGSTGTSQLVEHLRIASDGTLTGTDTSIGSNSDLRLKENVKDFNSGLDIISKLQPKTFNFKNQTEHLSGTRRGFIAQEVKAVDDYWIDEVEIKESNPDYKYVEDTKGQSFVSKLTDKDAMYVSAIQELKQEIDKLKLKLGEKNG